MSEGAATDKARKWQKALAALVILIPLLLVLFYALNILWLHEVFGYVQGKLAEVGVKGPLGTALAAVLWLPLIYFVGQAISPFGRKKRMIGLAGISIYIALYSVVAWVAQRDTYFNKEGQAVRFYAVTPEGYKFYDEAGVDPTYGIPLQPVTPQIVEAARGNSADLVNYDSLDDVPAIFDAITGESLVWYRGDPDGEIEFFSRGGFDPLTGEALHRVNADVIRRHRESLANQEENDRLEASAASRARGQEEKAEQARQFHNRYVRVSALSALERTRPCIIVATSGAEGERTASLLAQRLTREGLQSSADVLRSSALSGEVYDSLSRGDRRMIERLGLVGLKGHLLLGHLSLTKPIPTNSVENLVSVTAQFEWTTVSLTSGIPANGSIRIPAAGVSGSDASIAAIERLVNATLSDPVLRERLRRE